ncbi:hypothetical protein V8E36_009619 [Tilletia maclaganii]
MLPAQRNKVDISSLSEEEQKMFRLYGKLPARANVKANKSHERKYFDSGDYALSKAGKAPQQSVGTAIPNPERVPHASTVVGTSVAATVGGLASPAAAAVPSPIGAVAALSSGSSASSTLPGSLAAGTGASSTTGAFPTGVAASFPTTTSAPQPVSPLSAIPPPLNNASSFGGSDPISSTATATPLPISGATASSTSSGSSPPVGAASVSPSSLATLSPPPSAAQTSTSPSGLGSRNQPFGSFPVVPAHHHHHPHASAAAAQSPGVESPFPSSSTTSPLGIGGSNPAAPGGVGSPATSPGGASFGAGGVPRYLHRGSLSGSPGKEASSGLARAQPLSAEDMMEE